MCKEQEYLYLSLFLDALILAKSIECIVCKIPEGFYARVAKVSSVDEPAVLRCFRLVSRAVVLIDSILDEYFRITHCGKAILEQAQPKHQVFMRIGAIHRMLLHPGGTHDNG